MPAVLFVCQGNLCRSPAGEALLSHLARQMGYDLQVDSCGVAVWEEGRLPDSRMQEAVQKRGIQMESRTRAFRLDFFQTYDLILTSDKTTTRVLLQYSPDEQSTLKVHLVTEYSDKYKGLDIPDPYLGGGEYFDCVLDMLTDACEGILKNINSSERL
jgi:protein-tyrosine phosphatase